MCSLLVVTALLLGACAPTTTTTQSAAATATPAAGQGGVPSMGTPPAGGPGGAPPDGAYPGGAPPFGTPPGGGPGGSSSGEPGGTTANPVLAADCGAYTLDGVAASPAAGTSYDSATADLSSVCVINGGTLTLMNPTITKTGDSSSSDNSSFYGLNAAVLAGSGSQVTITGGVVTASGVGANGVFATGQGASVTLSNVTIHASGDGAHAVMATLGGTLALTGVNMTTSDAHSGAIATDRGSGTITVIGGTVETTGTDSPGIYSTGVISVSGATITATGSEAAVIEGGNSIYLENTGLSSSFEDKWGVMIYQSMSGDAEGTRGTFTMNGGSLAYTSTSGPLFYVNNSTGIITLKGVAVTAGSGTLIQAAANSRWGTAGANGGNVVFTADGQALTGDMAADYISTIAATLRNGSSLTGAINAEHTAKSVSLALDASSTWTVTTDSYLTCLDDSGGISGTTITNITGNGHNVYYDATACSALGGRTFGLDGGGNLKPAD